MCHTVLIKYIFICPFFFVLTIPPMPPVSCCIAFYLSLWKYRWRGEEETCCMGHRRSFIKHCPGLRHLTATSKHGKQQFPDERIQIILYGGLNTGKRSHKQPHFRFEDVCKMHMKVMDIDIERWEKVANDRWSWRHELLHRGLERGEKKRKIAAGEGEAC